MTKHTEPTPDLPPPAQGGSFVRHPNGDLERQSAASAAEDPAPAPIPEPAADPAPVEPPQKGTRK